MAHDFNFGWIPSSFDKRNLHSSVYAWSLFYPTATISVEKRLPTSPEFVEWYNQGSVNACVGASWSKAMATMNLSQVGPQKYSWRALYKWACENDGDPETSYEEDVGTYLWAGADALIKVGAYLESIDAFDRSHGMEKFYWIKSADEGRVALSYDRPLVFGVPWFESWMTPVQKNGDWWLPERTKWGRTLGGHAICCLDALDSMQALAFSNTWGAGYPEKVYISYKDIDYILSELAGECAVGLDLAFEPPIPPPIPPEVVKDYINVEGIWTTAQGKYKVTGQLKED